MYRHSWAELTQCCGRWMPQSKVTMALECIHGHGHRSQMKRIRERVVAAEGCGALCARPFMIKSSTSMPLTRSPRQLRAVQRIRAKYTVISSQGTSKPKPPPKTQSCNNGRKKKKSGTRCVSGPVSIPSPYEKKTIACKFHVLGTCSRRDCPWSHNPRICADAKRHLGLPFTDSELKAAGARRQRKDHSPALLGDSSSSDGTVSKCKSSDSA